MKVSEMTEEEKARRRQERYDAYVTNAGGCSSCHVLNPIPLTPDQVGDMLTAEKKDVTIKVKDEDGDYIWVLS